MPSNNGFRLDNRDGVHDRRKQAIEPDKDQSVGDRQFRVRGNAPAQHVQLMPQQDNLGFQPCLRLERRDHNVEKQTQERDHRGSAYLISPVTPARMEYSVRTAGSIIAIDQGVAQLRACRLAFAMLAQNRSRGALTVEQLG
jgi:hypothetical protein